MNKIKFTITLVLALTVLAFVLSIAADKKTQPATSQETETPQTTNTTVPATKSPQAGEQIKWQVVAGGGSKGSSTNFIVTGTLGQTAVGSGTSTNFGVGSGFWQNFANGSCMCGDADNNGIITISDAVYLINYIFAGGPAPAQTCLCDADGNSIITISDAVFLINYIFAGGPVPSGC